MRTGPEAVAVGLLAVLALGLAAGAQWFALAVVVGAAVLVVDLCTALEPAGARPMLPAAFVTGVGLPVIAMVRPTTALATLPLVVSVGVLATFALSVALRRRATALVIGSTSLAGLLVGLGTSGLVLLRATPDGFRWVVAAVLATLAVDVAGAVVGRVAPATHREAAAVAAAGAIAVLAGVALAAVLAPPAGVVAAAVAVIGVAAGVGLRQALAAPGASDATEAHTAHAGVAALAGPLLVAAPAFYLVARWAPDPNPLSLFPL